MKLYLITVQQVGDFYVLASNPSKAEESLKEDLKKSWGDYEVLNIKLLSRLNKDEEGLVFFGDKHERRKIRKKNVFFCTL